MCAFILPAAQEQITFWEARLDKPCFVYVVQGQKTSPVKVGVARKVQSRLDVLQTGNPEELHALYAFPGGHELEHQLHRKLKPYRMHGEWFRAAALEEYTDFFVGLASALVDTYDGSGEIPSYRVFDGDWFTRPKKRVIPVGEVTVRFVDPDELRGFDRLDQHFSNRERAGRMQ
jgi:hypothetical protein